MNRTSHLHLIAAACAFGTSITFAAAPKVKQAPTTPEPYIGIHPYFSLENIDTEGGETFRIMGMCFDGAVLYVTTFTPDRLNKEPCKTGRVLRVENATSAGKNGQRLKVTTLCDWLYEPGAIAVVGTNIYVGEKDRIVRFNQGTEKSRFEKGEETVLLDGLSTPNFHTFTIGFEHLKKDGELYLVGNLTTAVLSGGKRATMSPPNPKVYRGSTFTLGPITGNETADSLKVNFLAGGFRTPNGLGIGPANEIWVTDNQGVFNPSNELIRIKEGAFYGHYLLQENGRGSAFQPKDVDSIAGNPAFQTAATVHLPQGSVSRSPSLPVVIKATEGLLKPYNGQILLGEFTTGRLLRIFTEEVDGIWQGAVFQHSGGPSDDQGNDGFVAGPNRIVLGPDGHFYVGEIGHGGLWIFNNNAQGLQRLRVKSQHEAPENFNEILAARVVEGGFEIEFLKPVKEDSIHLDDVEVAQWTYFPTQAYGGTDEGKTRIKPHALSFNPSRKKATLLVNGLKDDSAQYLLVDGAGQKSNHNTGWVTHVKINPGRGVPQQLRANEFWYTLHKKIGGQDATANDPIELTSEERAHQNYQSLCLSCHVQRDNGWAAPNLIGIMGRKQKVIRDGKQVDVTIDRHYLVNAILNPDAEKSVPFKEVAMPPLGLTPEQAEAMVDYILKLE